MTLSKVSRSKRRTSSLQIEGVAPIKDSELVIGIVSAVGTDKDGVIRELERELKNYEYSVSVLSISKQIIGEVILPNNPGKSLGKHAVISDLMDRGNEARRSTKNNGILALGAAARIFADRISHFGQSDFWPRKAYIITSLKHPEEVSILRSIYHEGFFLIGVHSSVEHRYRNLKKDRITEKDATKLMGRDEDEHLPFGQRTRDTYELADYYLRDEGIVKDTSSDIARFLQIAFGHPYLTPTFDEFAMFMAFCSALRSADMNRQVGAVLSRDGQILATGANDSPRYTGGLYWPERDQDSGEIRDSERGRDYMRGYDSNVKTKQDLIEEISDKVLLCLRQSAQQEPMKQELIRHIGQTGIKDITEYGRSVHAEMEAILSCARSNTSCSGGVLYCTTFPCHNCAKHIVASGIERVVYVEPYPKSKAREFHDDSISFGDNGNTTSPKKVRFVPFVGVGPRRFFDLFSVGLGSGYPLLRKTKDGKTVKFKEKKAKLRIAMLPHSYLEREAFAATIFRRERDNGTVEAQGGDS